MRRVIYVDGAVGIGKSTFIEILRRTFESVLSLSCKKSKSSYHYNVDVLPEPLHRDWTNKIVDEIGYTNLLHFLLTRKIVAMEDWSRKIASDGLQEFENNVLIVERSPLGDRLVNDGCSDMFPELQKSNGGELFYYILIKNPKNENSEQNRLNLLYNSIERRGEFPLVMRIQRPWHISEYHQSAAEIVKIVLKL